jgi:hypothetical protein
MQNVEELQERCASYAALKSVSQEPATELHASPVLDASVIMAVLIAVYTSKDGA